ncbi:MAG TPA: O-antigen ligase family protein [Rhizomicrobium sp.]|nr:O-antigen ligase family protein [Rhizomicrobium sp.]
MANDHTLAFSPPHVSQRGWLPALGFVALLLLIFVGLDAFSPPPEVAMFGGVEQASRGDALRQILYLGTAALIALAALQRHGLGMLRAIPLSMGLLLAWCLASALWAPSAGLVLRRAGLEVVIVVSLMLSVETLGPGRAFTLWRWLLAAVLLVNFLSIPLVASARHGAGEIDPALVGNWRGLYGHKNIAGAVSAITAILFLFTRTGRGNWIGTGIALAACVFLAMSHSKSSAGFLGIALVAGLLYRLCWRDGLWRAILTASVAALVCAGIVFALIDADVIARLLEDPDEFTGRAEIWAAELRYIADHPLLGAGFGTFTNSGGQSPLHNYVSGSWVDAVSHGHNGYLQVLVTIGGIGFTLVMLAAVFLPFARLWGLDRADADGFKPMLMALVVFAVLHNFMESDFLEGDAPVWAALLLAIAALNSRARIDSLTSR